MNNFSDPRLRDPSVASGGCLLATGIVLTRNRNRWLALVITLVRFPTLEFPALSAIISHKQVLIAM
jgi:hypothetical protein